MIDVREPDEVVQGSIPSSVNIPLSVLSPSLNMNAEDFEKKFGFKKPEKAQEVIFYCRSGMRAGTAGDIAKRIRYERSVSLDLRPDDPPNSRSYQSVQLQRVLARVGPKRRTQSENVVEYASINLLRWTIPMVRTKLGFECPET